MWIIGAAQKSFQLRVLAGHKRGVVLPRKRRRAGWKASSPGPGAESGCGCGSASRASRSSSSGLPLRAGSAAVHSAGRGAEEVGPHRFVVL